MKTADKYEISTEIDVPKYSICKTIMKGKSCRSLDRVESNFAKGELKFEYNKGLRVSRSGVALTNPETCREFEGGTTLDLVSNFDTNQQIMSLKHKVSLAAETNCRNKSLVFNVELFNPAKRDFSKLFGIDITMKKERKNQHSANFKVSYDFDIFDNNSAVESKEKWKELAGNFNLMEDGSYDDIKLKYFSSTNDKIDFVVSKAKQNYMLV